MGHGDRHRGARRRTLRPVALPRPSSLIAELWALYQLLQQTMGPTKIAIDNLAVIEGLEKGRRWATAADRPYAHIWNMVFEKADDIGIPIGPGALQAIKVDAKMRPTRTLPFQIPT